MLQDSTMRSVHGDPLAVAVVVPIYNVEQYLSECLESVAAQTVFEQLQVILVDDGSTDSSGEVAASFAALHDNVTLIRQQNGGLGAARNRGLREVTAPLVTFLDSDDRLTPGALETLRRILLEGDAEVAIGRMQTFPKPTRWPWLKHLDEESKVLHGIEHAESLIHGASVCNKLFRTASLRRMGLQFGEGTHFEDVFVSLPVLLAADRIALTSTVVYEYRQRAGGGSIMNSIWSRTQNFWDHLAVEEFLARLRPSIPGPRRQVLDVFMVRSFQGFALRAPEALEERDLRIFFERCVALYGSTAPDLIHRGTLDARHRIAYVAFCLGDWDLFRGREDVIDGLEVLEDGKLCLLLRGERSPDMLQYLLRVQRSVVMVESLEPEAGGSKVRIGGHVVVDGLPLHRRIPCDLHIKLSDRDGGLRVRNEQRRVSAGGSVSVDWSGFVAEVPAEALGSGLHRLEIGFLTATGVHAVPARPSNGALRSARVLHLAGRRAVLVKQHTAAALRVLQGEGSSLRIRWGWGRLLDDVKHVLRRRPLWGARLLRLLTLPFMRSDVWLLGERRDTAQDNSFALFQYLRANRPEINAHYVLDQHSRRYPEVRALGHVVRHSSLRHKILMLHARALVNSYDIDAYLLPDGWATSKYLHYLAWRVGSRRVFLQHGVIYNDVSSPLRRGITGLDVFLASAEREAEAIREGMDYSAQVAVTGLPRFDQLNRGPVGRRILMMPTWRSQLVRPSYARDRAVSVDFDQSHFATFWKQLLHDPRLLDLLDRSDTTLEFFAHYEMAEVVGSLVPDHDKVLVSHHHSRSVQQAILDASLFVSDWSSTFFDAAYAGRPVVLAPFDEGDFRTHQYAKGYFDLERDGFGPVVTTVDDAVAAITRYVEGGFVRDEVFEERARTFFLHRDTRNCERAVEAISRAIAGQTVSLAELPAAEIVDVANLGLAS